MNRMTEIRWHGRGGQGAKTACLLLADAAFSAGKHVQGFPEYGPNAWAPPSLRTIGLARSAATSTPTSITQITW